MAFTKTYLVYWRETIGWKVPVEATSMREAVQHVREGGSRDIAEVIDTTEDAFHVEERDGR